MKMNLLFFYSSIVSACFLYSCSKSADDPIKPSSAKPTITASQSIQNNTATVSWVSKDATSLTCNGANVDLIGSLNFPLKDSTFVFVAKNEKFDVSSTIQIKKPLPPTISASFTYNDQVVDTLPYLGGKVKVKVNFSNGILELNGVKYENSPATFDFTVNETKTYDFKVVGPGGETSLPFTVPVIAPTETESLLISGTWIVTKLEGSYYTPDGPWTPFYDYIGSKMTFYFSPKKMKSETTACPEGICTSWYDWSLNGSLLTGFGDRKIISINSNEMVLMLESSSTQNNVQVPWFVKETYLKVNP